LSIPQTRSSDFYPNCLEKGLRSERALNIALGEMYVGGVSTRKVSKIIESMCGTSVSSAMVSNAAKKLDEVLNTWRERPLGKIEYLVVDARYEQVRVDNLVRDCAVLIALGIDDKGKREVLGVQVSLSEAEVHRRHTSHQEQCSKHAQNVNLFLSSWICLLINIKQVCQS
jgi:transposase-like protein